MLLVKKCQFSLYLVLVKTRLEIRFNNVVDRKQTFSSIKTKFFKVPKVVIFQILLVKKCQIFLYLFLAKTRLEVRLNNVRNTKEPFFDYKRKISKSPINRMFLKGLTHGFGQKMPILSSFVFGQNKTKNKV